MSWADISKELGIPVRTARSRYERGLETGDLTIDPAVQAAMDAIGTKIIPSTFWAKTDAKGQITHSVLIGAKDEQPDIITKIRETFEGLTPAEPVKLGTTVSDDLMTLVPLFDAHIGAKSESLETGDQDYDLNWAESDLRRTIASLNARVQPADTALLVIGGDVFHANDLRGETPGHGNKMDMAARQWFIARRGVNMLNEAIGALLTTHNRVIVRVLRGNHDPDSHQLLAFALEQRYYNEARVHVDNSPNDIFMFRWGNVGMFFHHGDTMKPEKFIIKLSDVCPFWSDVKHRHAITGHIHKESVIDFGAALWESLRAFTPPDAYGARFAGRRGMQFLTYHNKRGLINRAIDHIER